MHGSTPARDDDSCGEHFAYFLVRLAAHSGEGAWAPAGMVEQIGTGVKHRFASAEDLLGLLAAGSVLPANMVAADGERNGTAGP